MEKPPESTSDPEVLRRVPFGRQFYEEGDLENSEDLDNLQNSDSPENIDNSEDLENK